MDALQLLMQLSTLNLQASCVNLQSQFGSSAGLQNSDPSHSLMQLESKDLSSQLFGCTPPFISAASPSAVPSSSTPSSILANQEKGPLSLHPLSLEESNRVTKAPIEPSTCLCESPSKVDYQSSNSEADPSQRLIK